MGLWLVFDTISITFLFGLGVKISFKVRINVISHLDCTCFSRDLCFHVTMFTLSLAFGFACFLMFIYSLLLIVLGPFPVRAFLTF